MQKNLKIVLIDDNETGRHDLRVILEFLGEEVLACSLAEWKEQVAVFTSPTEQIGAVILGQCSSESLPKMLDALNSWAKNLPILLCAQDASDTLVKQNILALLEQPVSYSPLLNALHRAQVYREQYLHHRSRGEKREVELFRSL